MPRVLLYFHNMPWSGIVLSQRNLIGYCTFTVYLYQVLYLHSIHLPDFVSSQPTFIGYPTVTTYLDDNERIQAVLLAGRYHRLGQDYLFYPSVGKRVSNLPVRDKKEAVAEEGEGEQNDKPERGREGGEEAGKGIIHTRRQVRAQPQRL